MTTFLERPQFLKRPLLLCQSLYDLVSPKNYGLSSSASPCMTLLSPPPVLRQSLYDPVLSSASPCMTRCQSLYDPMSPRPTAASALYCGACPHKPRPTAASALYRDAGPHKPRPTAALHCTVMLARTNPAQVPPRLHYTVVLARTNPAIPPRLCSVVLARTNPARRPPRLHHRGAGPHKPRPIPPRLPWVLARAMVASSVLFRPGRRWFLRDFAVAQYVVPLPFPQLHFTRVANPA